ncbi:MAG: NmrA family NAD(P)-binding protein [Alphaproteobacteria bacterium]|nr:NmrA family NAD(P)-binding protein [Alphaproteobacteria bacterium]
MSKPIIAVVGGTGAQGGGVVDALLERGRFAVRVLTRDPSSDRAVALAARGVEVVAADLNDPSTLPAAFAGAYGAFVVTSFWELAQGESSETEQGASAVAAAREAGVEHFVWSTLPDSKRLSGGRLAVHHFTGKAAVDAVVAGAGFRFHTFVEAPMYYQNFTGMLSPQPLGDGVQGWVVPMDPASRSIHAGDVSEVGKVVARAFEQPDLVGHGEHLGVAPGLVSWNDLVETLNAQGHRMAVRQVPAEVYDGFFPGASELREMFQWFEGYTYLGPDAEQKLANTRSVYGDGLTGFADWAAEHMPAS